AAPTPTTSAPAAGGALAARGDVVVAGGAVLARPALSEAFTTALAKTLPGRGRERRGYRPCGGRWRRRGRCREGASVKGLP
ncbi:hypothetical protein ACFT0E_34820, partial [Streptomyces sp. NPDC057052]